MQFLYPPNSHFITPAFQHNPPTGRGQKKLLVSYALHKGNAFPVTHPASPPRVASSKHNSFFSSFKALAGTRAWPESEITHQGRGVPPGGSGTDLAGSDWPASDRLHILIPYFSEYLFNFHVLLREVYGMMQLAR